METQPLCFLCALHTKGQVLLATAFPDGCTQHRGRRCAGRGNSCLTAGDEVCSESWGMHRSCAEVHNSPDTWNWGGVGSLCILVFLQHAETLGRERGEAIFAIPLNCLPCTLMSLCWWAFMWAVTATREAAASVFSCVFLPSELAVLFWCVFNRLSPEQQCRPILIRRICFPPVSS